MAKFKKTMKPNVPAPPSPSEGIPFQGKALVGVGGVVVCLGFAVLSQADPLGRNWAACLAPFLILGGYAAIGAGLFLPPDPPPPAPPAAH